MNLAILLLLIQAIIVFRYFIRMEGKIIDSCKLNYYFNFDNFFFSFLRAFGSWGSGDAEFKGLEGVAIMSNGKILVCDRENHRVQIF